MAKMTKPQGRKWQLTLIYLNLKVREYHSGMKSNSFGCCNISNVVVKKQL
ncbi:hypothetical protein Hanom_Chr13g01204241 [Helianthus anomalus]